jgi:protein involved in polysaccharide export with SLBB domain
VFLEGNVLRPGRREYVPGMTLLDVIDSPGDLLPETFFDYGLIERESELNREPEYLSFDLRAALLDTIAEADVELMPRDKVFVFHRGHFRDVPTVSVRGEVRSPGSYEFKKDMRVLDLVLAAGGVTRDAWMGAAEIFRIDERTRDADVLTVDLERVLAADPSENVTLRDMDELAVHSLWEFREVETVNVSGEVNNPGTYPLTRGMRVSHLIYAGGNLKERAYVQEAELTRYEVVDGERRELRHFTVDLSAALAGNLDADVELQAYDRLLVRRISNWRAEEVVRVSGEVAFPGEYPIEAGERLSDLIERFGGFLDDAYLPAAGFFRTRIRTLQAQHLEEMADQLEADLARLSVPVTGTMSQTEASRRQAALESGAQLAAKLRQTEATGRMVVRVGPADEIRDTDRDILLADGDMIHIPKRPDFVMVMGQVNNPTAFQYRRGKNAWHFVSQAGGLTEFGDGGGIYVVKADGSVKIGRRTRIDPGDVVIVPEQLERFDGMQFLLDISQVLYQIGLAAASAYTVGLFD